MSPILNRFAVTSGSNSSNTPLARDPSPSPQLREAQHTFIYTVTGRHFHSRALVLSCKWYAAFLEFKISEAWPTLLQPVLVDIDKRAASPCDHDISVAFQFLTAVVLELNRRELALVNIVDEMYNKCLFGDPDEERLKGNQLVFAALGWISMV
jgi:hypothetical protein